MCGAVRTLSERGLSSAEICSLFTHAASSIAKNPDGLSRAEWLSLCAELYDDEGEIERAELGGRALTAPGGCA